ncbi:hypothetical protein [Erwinia aphidicola]|uniref:hypothetical protein n=1 Tax=Erwinia aphidicola TaxID=68334 RepID=UPI0030186AD4
MAQQGSIGRRIESCINSYITKDYESALVHLFPAIDKTGKLRRNKDGVGSRIKSFLCDEEDLISFISINSILKGIKFDDYTFPEAIYKFGRTSIMHEGELDPRLIIGENIDLSIGRVWQLPSTYILGMALCVILAPENSEEFLREDKMMTVHSFKHNINSLWGKSAEFRARINKNLQDEGYPYSFL